MPEGAVYVGRPTKWANEYRISDWGRNYCIELYREFLTDHPVGKTIAESAKHELAGKDLVCWCPLDQPCHADILLEIANS